MGQVEQLAATIRRLQANEGYDAKGIRTVWHRGRMQCEMLTWEHRDGVILKQELSFLGMVVEYRDGQPLRTGRVAQKEETTNPGAQVSHMVQLDSVPFGATLDYASHFLRHIPDRDYYAQHLLKFVNLTLSTIDSDADRTTVSNLGGFSRGKNRPVTAPQRRITERIAAERTKSGRIAPKTVLYVLTVALGGAVLVLALAAMVWMAT